MAGRPRKFQGFLSDEEKSRLQALVRSRTTEVRRNQRANVILQSSEGVSNTQIAKDIGLSTFTVCKILKKWALFGVDAALEDLQRPGRPSSITREGKAWVISLACQLPEDCPGAPRTQQWTIAALVSYIRSKAEAQGFPELASVQKSTVWEILNDRSIKPHRIKYYLVKKDEEFEEKAKKVLLLYKRVEWILQMTRKEAEQGILPHTLCGEVFISYDEKPGIQAVGNVAADRPAAPGHGTMMRDYEYRRFGTVSLLAGIDLMTGKVHGLVRDTHTSADFIDFLKLIDEEYDKSLCIHIILDNHSVHRSKAVFDYLSERPNRFVFTYTPKHASWLNLVESFFSKLARQALRGLRVKSKEDLVARIQDWIKATNEELVVFRWKWRLEDIEAAFDSPKPS